MLSRWPLWFMAFFIELVSHWVSGDFSLFLLYVMMHKYDLFAVWYWPLILIQNAIYYFYLHIWILQNETLISMCVRDWLNCTPLMTYIKQSWGMRHALSSWIDQFAVLTFDAGPMVTRLCRGSIRWLVGFFTKFWIDCISTWCGGNELRAPWTLAFVSFSCSCMLESRDSIHFTMLSPNTANLDIWSLL